MTDTTVQTTSSLRAQLDAFTLSVMEICSNDVETVKFAQTALAEGMHPGMVSDMLGFDMWAIIKDFTDRLERAPWWELVKIRKAMRSSTSFGVEGFGACPRR